ncbi:MAG TPA: hypothetical protein VKN99_14035 [Polyangia bacterium]|nr:hypothetical protein [Polyangia bacterium]
MTIDEISVGDGLISPGTLTLRAGASSGFQALTLHCNGVRTNLEITPNDGATEEYSVNDFYTYGCHGLIRALQNSGLQSSANVYVFFWGPNQFPGLMIGDPSRNVGFTFMAGGNPTGGFVKIP